MKTERGTDILSVQMLLSTHWISTNSSIFFFFLLRTGSRGMATILSYICAKELNNRLHAGVMVQCLTPLDVPVDNTHPQTYMVKVFAPVGHQVKATETNLTIAQK